MAVVARGSLRIAMQVPRHTRALSYLFPLQVPRSHSSLSSHSSHSLRSRIGGRVRRVSTRSPCARRVSTRSPCAAPPTSHTSGSSRATGHRPHLIPHLPHQQQPRAAHVMIPPAASVIPTDAPTVTFQGSGLLLVYQLGVAKYLSTHFQPPRAVSGASGGALVASLLACGVDFDEAFALNNHMVSVSAQRPLGPFVHGLQDLAEHLVHLLPPDDVVRERCHNRLFVSLTHVPSWRNRMVHRFDGGRQQLLRVVLSSMNLPLFLFPLFDIDGEYHIDGGLTNNTPRVTPDSITVSPTCSHADISPGHDNPLPRKHFFIPADPTTMKQFFDAGYQDTATRHDLLLRRGFLPL